ncbi:MAG: alpha/beta hydrolase-fold protein [Edaphocola sp.]
MATTMTTYSNIVCRHEEINSVHLQRTVKIDYYYPKVLEAGRQIPVLFFNDGQLLEEVEFKRIYDNFLQKNPDSPLLVIGIHAGKERVMEYGTAGVPNYKGQGAKATAYRLFFMHECLLRSLDKFSFCDRKDVSYAGFSLGGLTAFDTVWAHPKLFSKVGVFSGSFWWRNRALDDGYSDEQNRIIHNIVRDSAPNLNSALRFYFECGTNDERADRNHNGIIDSIDDTRDLIELLKQKGYREPGNIFYDEIPGGKHNGQTWAECIPAFLEWGWVK